MNELAEATVSNKELEKVTKDLSPEELTKATELSKQLVSNDNSNIVLFGADVQQRLGDFSVQMISQSKNKDLGEIGDILGELMSEIKDNNPNKLTKNGILSRILGRVKKNAVAYQKTSSTIDTIADQLKNQQSALVDDNQQLNQLYDKNLEYYQEVNLHIAAGQIRLNELETIEIPKLKDEATKTGDQVLHQKVKDLSDYRDRLEKRVFDLFLIRQISMQQAPQIRLIEHTNMELIEKTQAAIYTAIPLWQNQIAMTLALLRQEKVVKSVEAVTNTTNELLLKNSSLIKNSAIATAKASQRGVVDVKTLEITQNDLIDTITSVIAIQREGSQARKAATIELEKMDEKLKTSIITGIEAPKQRGIR